MRYSACLGGSVRVLTIDQRKAVDIWWEAIQAGRLSLSSRGLLISSSGGLVRPRILCDVCCAQQASDSRMDTPECGARSGRRARATKIEGSP